MTTHLPHTTTPCQETDPELWFHEGTEREAVRLCRECPVREACARAAFRLREPYGVWGALTPRQRAAALGTNLRRWQHTTYLDRESAAL